MPASSPSARDREAWPIRSGLETVHTVCTPLPGARRRPVQVFVQFGKKTFSVRSRGVNLPRGPPRTLEERFQTFWPKGSTFYAPLSGIKPGDRPHGRPCRPGAPLRMSRRHVITYQESFTS